MQRPDKSGKTPIAATNVRAAKGDSPPIPASGKEPAAPRRLKYAERSELEALPARIEALEKDLASLHQTMADPAFYQQDRPQIVEAKGRVETLEQQLREAYARWEHLESLAEG